jgi:hypothetical protein
MPTALAIRSASLVTIALFLTWYAGLGGWRALHEALPEIGLLAPTAIWTPPGDSTEILLRLPIQLALFVAALVLIRLARARRVTAKRGKLTSPTERRLWAEHLAWLAARSGGSGDATSVDVMSRPVVLVSRYAGRRPQGAQDGLLRGSHVRGRRA